MQWAQVKSLEGRASAPNQTQCGPLLIVVMVTVLLSHGDRDGWCLLIHVSTAVSLSWLATMKSAEMVKPKNASCWEGCIWIHNYVQPWKWSMNVKTCRRHEPYLKCAPMERHTADMTSSVCNGQRQMFASWRV